MDGGAAVSVLDDKRVYRYAHGGGYQVTISHGKYLIEFDDRDGLWWAFTNGIRLDYTRGEDPLACSSDACSGWKRPEELIAVLLGFDGEQVQA